MASVGRSLGAGRGCSAEAGPGAWPSVRTAQSRAKPQRKEAVKGMQRQNLFCTPLLALEVPALS